MLKKVLSKFRTQSDSEITIGLQKSSKPAFKALFDRYHKKVYNVSRRMNISHEDAEGVVQDVFLTLWEKRKLLDKDLSINAFIITIAKRLVYNKIRSQIVRTSHKEAEIGRGQSLYNSTEDYIIFSEMERNAQEGIERLPENRKQIFMLSKQSGLSNDEIAEQLNISKRTVENQLYRATKSIKEHIEDKSQSDNL